MIKTYRDITLLLRTWNEISRLQDRSSYILQTATHRAPMYMWKVTCLWSSFL